MGGWVVGGDTCGVLGWEIGLVGGLGRVGFVGGGGVQGDGWDGMDGMDGESIKDFVRMI